MILKKIFILIILCVSCNQNKITNKKITGIKNNSSLVYDDNYITFQNLDRFFSKDSLFTRKTINVNDNFCRELEKIKNNLKKEKNKHFSIEFEVYEYAMIFDKDTLYTNRGLGFWRYKNKSTLYKSKLGNEVVKNIDFNKLNN